MDYARAFSVASLYDIKITEVTVLEITFYLFLLSFYCYVMYVILTAIRSTNHLLVIQITPNFYKSIR